MNFRKISLNATLPAALFILASLPALARDENFKELAPGTPAPELTATGWNGKPVHLSDFRGKTVVADFWATWCGPCNQAMPGLETVLERYKGKKVVVLATCVWDSIKDADTWVPQHSNLKFTFAFDPVGEAGRRKNSPIGNAFKLRAIPTTYIIDPFGKIVDAGCSMDDDEISAAIDKSLTQQVLYDAAAAFNVVGVQKGEIMLQGTIIKTADGASTFNIAATSATSPNRSIAQFDAKDKTIVTTAATTYKDASNATIEPSTLTEGTEVNVVGKDMGAKGLCARAIEIAP